MNLETLTPIIVSVINYIIGPLIVLVVGKWYTDRTIRQTNQQLKGYTDESVQKNKEQLIERIEDEIGDHEHALKKLNDTLIEYLDERTALGPVELDLKLIAVAMTFSWDFILDRLPDILDRYANVSVNLSACFVDWEHLADPRLKISTTDGVNWAQVSQQREKDIRKYKKSMQRYGSRLSCGFRTYKNIPHWHGWLVTEKKPVNDSAIRHLFLGRTRWQHTYPDGKKRDLPKLTVGQNEYRFYTDQTAQGRNRISLFEGWHTYYFERICEKKSINR